MKKLFKGILTASLACAILFGGSSLYAGGLDQPDVPKVRSIEFSAAITTHSLDQPDVPKVR